MMRVLHAVKPHEQFVASGIYQHQENGGAVGTIEQWSIHQLPDGAHLFRVDYDAREERSLTILVEALSTPGDDSRFERFDTHLISVTGQPFHKARLTTTFSEDGALIGIAINSGEMGYHEMAFAPGALVYPPGHVFAGALVKQLITQDPPTPIFSLLTEKLDNDMTISEVHALCSIDPASIILGGRQFTLRCFTLAGSNPALNGVFCLNEHDILMRRTELDEVGQERVIALTEYAHR